MRNKLILLLFIIPLGLSAQNSDDKLGAWYIYNGSFFVRQQTELFLEVQLRLREVLSNKEEIFFRPFYIHHFNNRNNLGLGYTYHVLFSDAAAGENSKSLHENRIILQYVLFTPVGKTNLQHRFRLEQRWLKPVNSDVETKNRFRYRFWARIPLASERIEKGVFFASLYNELFIDLTNGLSFDQNRLFGGMGYQFADATSFTFGFLYQRRPQRDLYRLQFWILQRLDFYDD